MQKIDEHLEQLKTLSASVEEDLQPALEEIGKLDFYKNQLKVLVRNIKAIERNSGEVKPQLKEQKIKLTLKIDEIEKTIIKISKLADWADDLARSMKKYLINEENISVSEVFDMDGRQFLYSANQARKRLILDIKTRPKAELAEIMNKISGYKKKVFYVQNNRIVCTLDAGFQEAFNKSLSANFVEMFSVNEVTKTKFTISEMLKYHVNYTLKRNTQEFYDTIEIIRSKKIPR